MFSGEKANEEKAREILSIISFNEKVKPTTVLRCENENKDNYRIDNCVADYSFG